MGRCTSAASLTSDRSLRTRSSLASRACRLCTLYGGVDSAAALAWPVPNYQRVGSTRHWSTTCAQHWCQWEQRNGCLMRLSTQHRLNSGTQKTIDAGHSGCKAFAKSMANWSETPVFADTDARRVCKGHRRMYLGRIVHVLANEIHLASHGFQILNAERHCLIHGILQGFH